MTWLVLPQTLNPRENGVGVGVSVLRGVEGWDATGRWWVSWESPRQHSWNWARTLEVSSGRHCGCHIILFFCFLFQEDKKTEAAACVFQIVHPRGAMGFEEGSCLHAASQIICWSNEAPGVGWNKPVLFSGSVNTSFIQLSKINFFMTWQMLTQCLKSPEEKKKKRQNTSSHKWMVAFRRSVGVSL